MARRTQRRLELVALGEPLRQYAARLQPDRNAAFMLVHQALAAAINETPDLRASASLEQSLRADIVRGFVAANDDARAHQ